MRVATHIGRLPMSVVVLEEASIQTFELLRGDAHGRWTMFAGKLEQRSRVAAATVLRVGSSTVSPVGLKCWNLGQREVMALRPLLHYRCGISQLLAAAALILLASGHIAACRPEHTDSNFRRRPLQASPAYPAPEVLEATAPHTATVFLFHGLGGGPKDLDFLGPALAGRLPFVKWVSGRAPRVSVLLFCYFFTAAWVTL